MQQQTRRGIEAGGFERMAHDLRVMLRVVVDRAHLRTPVSLIDSRTLQSGLESGGRAGYDGAKRHKGAKVHLVVDKLGHLLTLTVTSTA